MSAFLEKPASRPPLGRRVLTALSLHRELAIARASGPAAERLYRLADGVAHLPWRASLTPLPSPIEAEGVLVDVTDDLCEFTGLPRPEVVDALVRRRRISFRSEWRATPRAVRVDHWFYLSSRTYLFGNATHVASDEFTREWVVSRLPPGARVLDFGGGAGNLTLMLALHGLEAWYTELNSLQRDFIRFRLHKHGLESRVRVVDWWQPLPEASFDAIVAMDVLEHLPEGARALEDRLLPSLKPDALIVENSPFVVNASNPMHHEDFGLEAVLSRHGFRRAERGVDGTCAWRRDGS